MSAALSWAVFLFVAADQPESATSPPPGQLAAVFLLCGGAAVAFAVFGHGSDDHNWRVSQGSLLTAARGAPLIFGLGLLLWLAPARELRHRALPLAALACPLFTPVPGWLRQRIDLSLISAWGTEQILRLAHQPVERRGVLLLLTDAQLVVDSECSGLGAVLQLLAIVLLLALVTRAPARRIAPLIPLAVAIGFLVNFARVAVLAWLLQRGELDRFSYWHAGQGGLAYAVFSSLLLLALALPMTVPRSPARSA
jgi:exosortase/archaeosortase family protein